MRTVKPLHFSDWKAITPPEKQNTSEFIKLPWDLFGEFSELINSYTNYKEGDFTSFKAFILLQWEFSFYEVEDKLDVKEMSLNRFDRFKLPRRVKETNLKVTFQYQYAEDAKIGFIKLPYKAFDKCKGKLGMLVEAILNTYYIDTYQLLWRVIVSKYGTEVYHQTHVKRYWDTVSRKRRDALVEATGGKLMVIPGGRASTT